MESYPSSDFVRELPSLVFVRELPVPPLREWSPTPRRTSLESYPSLVFVRELPSLLFVNGVLPLVGLRQSKDFLPSSSLESSRPPLREWSPTPRRTSLESFPSLVFVRELPSLLFVNGVLPLVGLR
ncbi:Hypothetical protein FKW44_004464 [Caligus rogercresseyi]|uniref:Uncharacterized protein n=1 Tax=Caligus rogercresseyi TaxID=217165 RepID=A0A7T8HLZ0_CALRO|nr:Hypothetical protein FKW44_004464 [Caligus rogercresseyi]